MTKTFLIREKGILDIRTDRRSLLGRDAGTSWEVVGLNPTLDMMVIFPATSPNRGSTQAQATDRNSSTYGCDFEGGWASRSNDPLRMISYIKGPQVLVIGSIW